MTLGRFGGSEPRLMRVSSGGASAMADQPSKAKAQAYGDIGDLPIGYRDASARVYNSAAISTDSGVLKTLTFDSEAFDTDDMHSTSTNTSRLTVNTAGKYLIFGGVRFAANGTGKRRAIIRINAADDIAEVFIATAGAGEVTAFYVSAWANLVVGDYAELIAYQDSGGALNVVINGTFSPEFSMIWIH